MEATAKSAAFSIAKRLPDVFANAHMKLSETTLKTISVIGMGILLVQGSLSFSDIDRIGWLLVAAYILLVIVYIQVRSKNRQPASSQDRAAPSSGVDA